MSEPLELKKTLNLPKTDFPMKASLPLNEPKQLAAWQGAKLYQRILDAREGKPLFVLHDGPPYPTGTIHLGTGLNKILKDLIVKSKSMAGHYAPYVPGWDCHGLPIETQVEKELGGKGKVSPAEFRQRCRDYATRYVEQHKRDFQRLGVFGRWNDPYLTMSFSYETIIAGNLLDFMEKGYVYRGRKPVYWCIYDNTALAEAEVEYEDHTSPSVWVTFKIVGGGSGDPAIRSTDVSAVIWTTTPWTLPHNRALAFHPDFDYVVVQTEKGKLLLAADRLAALAADCQIKQADILETYQGRQFEGVKFQHPFLPIEVPGILAEYVTLDQGSGIVHTAPGHGSDDFLSGQKSASKYMRRLTTRVFTSKVCRNTEVKTFSPRIPSSSNFLAIAVRCLAITPTRTATRIVGAATIRLSSAPPSSGSSRWIKPLTAEQRRCGKRLWKKFTM